ncbi:MAG: hypothetical protein M1831_000886 [Alyxoria varia]|nr:MAG: hypothetical protein M1831_000886 [Alyxoria varia]
MATTADPLSQLKNHSAPKIQDVPLKQWDSGLFNLELVRLDIAPPVDDSADEQVTSKPQGQVQEGTYGGTQLALTEVYAKIEESFVSYCDAIGVETTIPQQVELKDKKERYKFQPDNSDSYPPHLDVIPNKEENFSQFQIFDRMGLLQAMALVPKVIPKKTFLGKFSNAIVSKLERLVGGEPFEGSLLADIERNNKESKNRKTGTDVMRGANIGDLDDWFSDARFAEQQFTGTNPTTITSAGLKDWVPRFVQAAQHQKRDDVVKRLQGLQGKPHTLYVQDFSVFKSAIGVDPKTTVRVADEATGDRYGCASVTLFQLHESGRLHPLAIITDWKGNINNSITLFNTHLDPASPSSSDKKNLDRERTDYPWRYAKTCAQVSDWTRHELAIHLTHTHLVEEVVIVATNRCIPDTHIVYQLLKPHWYKTLPLNAAARETLVPKIIVDLVGYPAQAAFDYINAEFEGFDFVGKYIPNDLRSRGFPPEALGEDRFRNYAYARNMSLQWAIIHKFVRSMLSPHFSSDSAVANDPYIRAWTAEIQSPSAGRLKTFPTIKTLESLADAVSMCIHTAAPQHTAVNYLQNYYQAFVVNKPPALCDAPPKSVDALKRFEERDLVKALPIGRQREWLLAAHLPWLLSFRVAENRSLVDYANSLWNLYKKKDGGWWEGGEVGGSQQGKEAGGSQQGKEAGGSQQGRGKWVNADERVRGYAKEFFEDLNRANSVFEENSRSMTEGCVPYNVMDTAFTAVSILI